jgi:hypothetical protein
MFSSKQHNLRLWSRYRQAHRRKENIQRCASPWATLNSRCAIYPTEWSAYWRMHIQMGWTYPRTTQWCCIGKGGILNLVKDLYIQPMSYTLGRQQKKSISSATINGTKISRPAEVPLSLSEYHTECQSRRCHTPPIYQWMLPPSAVFFQKRSVHPLYKQRQTIPRPPVFSKDRSRRVHSIFSCLVIKRIIFSHFL